MKVFYCVKRESGSEPIVALISAFNKGHACKQLAKEMEAIGKTLSKDDEVTELDPEENKKGRVILLRLAAHDE